MSPVTTRELAQAAYAAYGDSTGHTNYQGHPMPDWEELTDRIQLAWIEAAGAVLQHHLAGLFNVRSTSDPSVGDVVLVAVDPTDNNGATSAPAIVTRVWSATTVNVRVLHDSDAVSWRTSLLYRDSLADAAVPAAVWTWPGGEN